MLDDIAQFRRELEALLWDFDDYVEVDEFDADKFSELQKASRNAALKTLDILKRMRLVAPAPVLISPPPSEVGGPTSITTRPISGGTERLSEQLDGRESALMSAEAGPEAGPWGNAEVSRTSQPISDMDTASSRRSGPIESPLEPPPRPPSANPWQVGRTPAATLGIHYEEGDGQERRPPVGPDSPTIPQTQLVSPDENPRNSLPFRDADDAMIHDEREQRMRAASQSRTSNSEGSLSPLQSHRWTNSTQGSTESMWSPARSHSGFLRGNDASTLRPQGHEPAISRVSSVASAAGHPPLRPDSRVIGAFSRDREMSLASNTGFPPRSTSVANQNFSSYILSSRKPSTESINSSVFDIVESLSPTEPSAPLTQRQSTRSAPSASSTPYQSSAAFSPPRYPGPPPLYQTPPVPYRRTSGVTIRSQSSGGRTAHPGMGLRGMDEGLIPVDMENSVSAEAPIPARDPDCTITPSSSFYKLKGFCKGAQGAQNGHLGFKRIKRPIGVSHTFTFLMIVILTSNRGSPRRL